MKRLALAAALLISACASSSALAQTCPPAGSTRAELEALKGAAWTAPDDAARNRLARSLTACLASPDPALRDGLAYEALQHWLRARALSRDTMLALADDLEARLVAADADGFARPFAALALAEVARADRIEPFLTPARRTQLLEAAIAYLTGVRDYRGFDETEGWRHGVAHAADLMLQLSLNPALEKPDLLRIAEAVAVQVAPEGYFYIYGESERLARPLIFMAQRGLISAEEWQAYFARFSGRENVYASQAGLAWRHNVNGFLHSIWLNARISRNAEDDALLPGAEAALRALP